MRWNIAAECISAVVLCIIWAYSRKGNLVPTLKNRMFQYCFTTTFLAMVSNILSTVMLERPAFFPVWLTWLVTMIYFAATPLMGMAYFHYTAATVYEGHKGVSKVIFWASLPGALYLLLVLANPFLKELFDISPNGSYAQGSFIISTYVVFYLYCLAVLVLVLMKRSWVETPIRRILASFPIVAAVVIIIQQIYPTIILSGSAATCALLLIYLYLQNKQISIDHLTGLPNRQEYLKMLELKYSQGPFTIVVLSLREFKQINDTFGQQNGDLFLRSIAAYLQTIARNRCLYRISGDEFALIVEGKEPAPVQEMVETLKKRMNAPWQAKEFSCIIHYVLGVVRYPDSADTLPDLLNGIEYAVSHAKGGQRGEAVCYCGRQMLKDMKRRGKIADILKEKLQKDAFEVYYQPIYSIADKQFVLAESLLRIPQSDIGPIYPDEFIPIAEETGLIVEMTYQVLGKVCRYVNELEEENIQIRGVHVNFSAVQFLQKDLVQKVADILHQNHTPSRRIKIEITESVLAENPDIVTAFAAAIHEQGILLGLDDFGTGYSNIVTVMTTPLDIVKLDRSLVWSAMESQKAAIMFQSLVRIFHEMGLKVLAEGVETMEQNRFVVESSIDFIQGFFYARPMPGGETKQFLFNHQNL